MPNSRLKFALFCLFLVIFALWAGYLIGRSNLWINKLHYNKTANKIEIPEYKPLFTTQSATIQGKITKFDGTNLIVTNSKGISGRIKLAKNFTVKNSSSQTISSDPKTIEFNKDVTLILESNYGKYFPVFQVVSINY